MARRAWVLIDSGVDQAATAARLGEIFGVEVEPLAGTPLLNLGDLGGRVRGDVAPAQPDDGFPWTLVVSDVANEDRPEKFVDEQAGQLYERIAAATGWRLAVQVLDDLDDLQIVRERKALGATA